MSTCKYCGNGDNHNSLCPGKVISDLNNELAAAKAENERLILALETENQAATVYAKQVAHWVEKHDKLLAEREEREPEVIRMAVNIIKRLAVFREPRYELPADSFIEEAVKEIFRLRPVPAVPEGMVQIPLKMFDDLIQYVESEHRGSGGRDLTGGFLTDVCSYRASLPAAQKEPT